MTAVAAASTPEPVPPNKEAVKVLAKAVGIREAARRMGLDEHRVLKWSQRDPAGPWGPASAPPTRKQLPAQVRACPQAVLTPSEALVDALADDSRASRIALSRGLRRVAEHVADLDPAEALERAQHVKATVGSLATVHAWEAKQQSTQVMISVGAIGLRRDDVESVLDVSAEVVATPPHTTQGGA